MRSSTASGHSPASSARLRRLFSRRNSNANGGAAGGEENAVRVFRKSPTPLEYRADGGVGWLPTRIAPKPFQSARRWAAADFGIHNANKKTGAGIPFLPVNAIFFNCAPAWQWVTRRESTNGSPGVGGGRLRAIFAAAV